MTAPSLDVLRLLREVWTEQVRRDVEKGRVVTEHDLQCALYHHLRNALPNASDARLYVNRSISFSESESRRRTVVPDLCLLDGDREGWLIELKVQHASGAGPLWKHDVEKFVCLVEQPRFLNARGTADKVPLPAEMSYLFATLADDTCEAVDRAAVAHAAPKLLGTKPAKVFWAAGHRTTANQWTFEGPDPLRELLPSPAEDAHEK